MADGIDRTANTRYCSSYRANNLRSEADCMRMRKEFIVAGAIVTLLYTPDIGNQAESLSIEIRLGLQWKSVVFSQPGRVRKPGNPGRKNSAKLLCYAANNIRT